MAEATGILLEGVFAISKPPHLSSAQVLRDLQTHFAPSTLFAPLLALQRARDAENPPKRRRFDNDNVFKMGHGGTLDPLATGVLIVGIGRGTKHLNTFLTCTKTYETVVLFGKSTDTFDVAGKIVASAPYTHITRELVEEKLAQFRGPIKQVPPIYSALKIQGMKAYEYARSGKDLPRELESRDMVVTECKMVEFYEGGTHEYRWPAEEATEEEKGVAARLMGAGGAKAEDDIQPSSSKPQTPADQTTTPEPTSKSSKHTHAPPSPSSSPSPAPAALITLTVSSGFYVRSFAHDLGLACSSLGIMASLIRSRQAGFTTTTTPSTSDSPSSNPQTSSQLLEALPYTDLALGESTWGPKIRTMLERWNEANPAEKPRVDDRDRDNEWSMGRKGSQHRYQSRNTHDSRGSSDRRRGSDFGGHRRDHSRSFDLKRPRRNSSSPEA